MTAFTVYTAAQYVLRQHAWNPLGRFQCGFKCVRVSIAGPSWLLRPVREADYCDERIRLSTSLSQQSRQFFACYGRRSVLPWCRCGTLCTSGVVDDVTFARRCQEPATWWECVLKTTQQMAARIWLRGLYSSWLIYHRSVMSTSALLFDAVRYLVIHARAVSAVNRTRRELEEVENASWSESMRRSRLWVRTPELPIIYTNRN